MKIIKLNLFLVLYSMSLLGQDSFQFPQISKSNLSNCEIKTSKYYNGESLWGLINGGADVYLEYGFDKLLFQEIIWENKKFRIEIYKMASAESAFGIYSISKYKCNNNNSDIRFICITPYQIQGCKGNFYISIANEIGDSLTQKSTLEIYELLENQIGQSDIQIPTIIKSNVSLNNYSKLKFIAGPLGLQNGYPNWSSLFENLENFSFFHNEIEVEGGPITLAEIRFKNKEESDIFINNLKNFKNIQHVEELSNGNIFIVEGILSLDELKNITE